MYSKKTYKSKNYIIGNKNNRFTLFNGYPENDFQKGYDENLKRLLCNNILAFGKCNYGDKCMYSHSLEEQKKDKIREQAYGLIDHCLNNNDYVVAEDIYNDKELLKTIASLCKVCPNCEAHKCPGGYNCKYGVFDKKLKICEDDLYYCCCDENCASVHMSKIGLTLKNDSRKKKRNIIKNNEPLVGTLLTDDFFKKNHVDDAMSESDESYDRICQFLNQESSDSSCDESIFITHKKNDN